MSKELVYAAAERAPVPLRWVLVRDGAALPAMPELALVGADAQVLEFR